jgi:DNA repair protein RecN (Recombination protein N)
MLLELEIRDFALIDKVNVSFTSGLNVLTGETGAGKSILIDAVNAVLGGKIGGQAIRAGADKAVIEATFSKSPELANWLSAQELDSESKDELYLAREITRSGGRLRINGTLVNTALVSELRARLLSVHAQHEARTLLSAQAQLELLDGLGEDNHKRLKADVRSHYARKRELQEQLNELKLSEDERLRLLDFANFQLKELVESELTDSDEDDRIACDCRILENVVALEDAITEAQHGLSGGESDRSASTIDLLQTAIRQVKQAAELDSNLVEIAQSLTGALETIESSARELRRYRDRLTSDPETLSGLQSRLNQLAAVKRKYGPTLKEAIARRCELTLQVEKLSNAQVAVEQLEAQLAAADKRLQKAATELSSARVKLAAKLSKEIQAELSELAMERCRFEIAVETAAVGANGCDKVEFLISPNPGQPLFPLAKIASGGELSRVMLAVKSIFAQADQVATVVFDEIDTGLSGRVLQNMRDKLARLALSHQILCITHQPIIASVADNHILIRKRQSASNTVVQATTLDAPERVKSLAEMASGHSNQSEALQFAQSLLDEGSRLRCCNSL